MTENASRKPEEVLSKILADLQSKEVEFRLEGIAQLHQVAYSSEAIRNELEKLALHDPNEDIRAEALSALDLATQKNVSSKLSKLTPKERGVIAREISGWETSGLLEKQNAQIIRKRYEFDLTPAIAPKTQNQPVKESAQETQPEAKSAPAPVPQVSSPTLTQTLLSETSIKIALYLGAFFVIASATIFAALIEVIRLPILILGTLIFGGLAVAIKKRLPQPSFTLFIVFSFLLPITANVLEETFNLSLPFIAAYWVFVSAFMALIWAGGTWLYESRLFSVTAFVSLVISFYRVGDMFDANAEFYPIMLGLAALAGLLGAWMMKQWRDGKFALPLFLSAQVLQAATIATSMSVYIAGFINNELPLWNLAHILTWGFAFTFYILSNNLYPFILFPWFAAGALVGMPFFIGAAFELEEIGNAITFSVWGLFLAAVSETAHWLEKIRKYSLPVLVITIFISIYGISIAFANNETTGFAVSLWFALIFAALHFLRPRGWLWAFALLSFIFAYFTFFNLPFLKNTDIFFGYKLLGLSVLFLLPDLFTSNDFSVNPHWRIAPRVYGIFITLISLLTYLITEEYFDAAIMFGVYAIFFALYTFAQRKAIYGYLPASYLALTIIYLLNYLDVDAWLPALTTLSALYFGMGAILRARESWSRMLRNSGLILGGLVAVAALIFTKSHGGWYALVIGLIFAAEMYISKNGWFEMGLPILFSIGAFLFLKESNVEENAYHLLTYSFIWLLSDLTTRLTFANPRPLRVFIRGVGALITVVNYAILIFDATPRVAPISFGAYLILLALITLIYRKPDLLFTVTTTFPLFVIFLLREFDFTRWIHPLIIIAVGYYGLGFILRALKILKGWDAVLLTSGLVAGGIASLGAVILGGLDAALPPALAATLFAVEAFARKNVWLGFPANGFYLLAYFIILYELDVDQPQFYSIGAALLGIIQHYFLTRAESKTGAFIMGMVSQLTLLGTTYIQMANTERLLYFFFVLFFQAMAVIVYGVITRSRSLTFTPIGIIVLGLFTVLYSALKGLGAVVLVGCSGVILLMLGILAVILRSRISNISEKMNDWKA